MHVPGEGEPQNLLVLVPTENHVRFQRLCAGVKHPVSLKEGGAVACPHAYRRALRGILEHSETDVAKRPNSSVQARTRWLHVSIGSFSTTARAPPLPLQETSDPLSLSCIDSVSSSAKLTRRC
jgi:hypothetical protein